MRRAPPDLVDMVSTAPISPKCAYTLNGNDAVKRLHNLAPGNFLLASTDSRRTPESKAFGEDIDGRYTLTDGTLPPHHGAPENIHHRKDKAF